MTLAKTAVVIESRPSSCVAADGLKSDTVDLATESQGLRCEVAGNIQLLFSDDTVPVTLAFAAGVDYPYRVRRIYASGTTATGIFVLR